MVHQSKSEVRSQKEKKPDLEKQKRLVGQAVKTPASHAGNMGSIPIRVTSFHLFEKIFDLPIDFIFLCVILYMSGDIM